MYCEDSARPTLLEQCQMQKNPNLTTWNSTIHASATVCSDTDMRDTTPPSILLVDCELVNQKMSLLMFQASCKSRTMFIFVWLSLMIRVISFDENAESVSLTKSVCFHQTIQTNHWSELTDGKLYETLSCCETCVCKFTKLARHLWDNLVLCR